MHRLLQDMGREIVRQESPKEPGKRTRLQHHKDSLSVLSEKTGTETIEGLVFNTHMLKIGESLLHPEVTTVINSYEVVFEMEAFARMHNLRLLQLSHVRLVGCYKDFPKRLRWLCWLGFPSESIPSNFPLGSLVALDMRYSKLKQFWQGTKPLRLLKILNLSHSHSLARTPDFLILPNLERLILKHCTSLIQVHESIGYLDRLVFLNLKDCKSLKTLPRNIGLLKFLETLVISGCSNLDGPLELQNMEYLRVLNADGIAIGRLLATTEEVKPWHAFFWPWVSKPIRSPEIAWASLPCSLVSLSLEGCNLPDDAFPRNLNNLFSLKDLNLSRNSICMLPDCIKGFDRLENLELNRCTKLQSLVGLPDVSYLELHHCISLEKISFRSSPYFPRYVGCTQCTKVVEFQDTFRLEPIGKVDTKMVDTLGLFNLESMGNDEVNFFHGLSSNILKCPIQGLYEYGIFSTFVPGGGVPTGWCGNKSTGSSICFIVPSLPNLRIRGLNVCCVYALSNNQDIWWPPPLFIKLSNKSKDLKWIYGPGSFGIPEDGKDMIWFSHWKFGNKLVGGDEVNVSIVVDVGFQVKQCGFKLVYEQEQIMGTQDNNPCSSWPYGFGVDSFIHNESRVIYLYHDRCLHHTYEGLRDDDWRRTECYKNLHEESVEATEQEEAEEYHLTRCNCRWRLPYAKAEMTVMANAQARRWLTLSMS
ncbi:hypothetical protein F0562_029119 [Nyssa sinensis]|uniref:Disease resistance protein RPS4B/Roq1-like leucine-rich repeats domain-containing protein n=1 Tax=Nyssa sinensis TaxID=561372 RepID=A0A5J5B657_9ASTE|nr:hypothetical protein F0562_029119 [Nyssa sinensis]